MTGRAIEHLDIALARPRRVRRLRVRARPSARASRSRRSTSARRCRTGCGASARRDPHQRDDPGVARRPRRPARRTEPTSPTSAARSTTRPTRSCTARCTSPTHGPTKFRRRGARRAGRADHRRRRPHAGAVHELAGDGRRRGRGASGVTYPILTQRDLPKPALVRAFAGRRRDVPVRDRRVVPGRRRARVDAVAGRDRPDPVPAARRSVAVGAPRAARPAPRSARSTCPGRR